MAASAVEQIGLFPSGVNVADEVALILSDAMLLLEQETDNHELSEEILKVLRTINDELAVLSGRGNASFWSTAGLKTDIRWHRYRLLAKDILKSIPGGVGQASVHALYAVKQPGPSERKD
ncbi:MAG TPA: hypothetical protein VGQ46_10460 [Thermoanaerobaculia bacterium]|jgi:hypothetical protein|nr:hypothetical protein [Thermoanaerobaculia bacterium]